MILVSVFIVNCFPSQFWKLGKAFKIRIKWSGLIPTIEVRENYIAIQILFLVVIGIASIVDLVPNKAHEALTAVEHAYSIAMKKWRYAVIHYQV